MNKSNTANYKPKDFAELLAAEGQEEFLLKHYNAGIGRGYERQIALQQIVGITLMTNIYNLKKYIHTMI